MIKNNLGIKVEECYEINPLIIKPKEFISVLKIDLGQGKTEFLNLYKNSKPDELAYNFCLRHKLDFKSVKFLINKIKYFKDNNEKNKLLNSLNIIKIKELKEGFDDSFKNKKNAIKNFTSNNIYKKEKKIKLKRAMWPRRSPTPPPSHP